MNKVDINVESSDDVNLAPVKKKYDQFASGLVTDMKTMGDKAGKNFTEGIAAGMEKGSARVVKAQDNQVRAVERLALAQQRLAEVQGNDTAKMSARMAAEQAFTNALRGVQAATDDVAAAERHLSEERSKSAALPETAKSKIDFDYSGGIGRLKSGLFSELKATGIQGGAILAGALGAGISSIGAAGLFVGIAAAAQSQNAIVRESYSHLWEQIKQGAQESSSVLAHDFVLGAEKLGATFNRLNPQMKEGFIAAKPAVDALFDGVSRMAQEAMPGLVVGAKAASDASKGLADMMDSTGRGVAAFFTESAEGAAAGGDAFRSFGNIVERLGAFAGRILAQLANSSATVFPQLEKVVDSAAHAIETFGSVALPGIASGAGLALSGLSLLLNLASSLMGALGPLIPMAGTFATSLKLIDMVSFGQVGASWDKLKTSIGEAEGFAGKAKAGFTGLLTSGFLPVMVGGIALTGVLNELSKDQQRAAEAARNHEQNVSSLAEALRKSKGAMDDNVRAATAQALSNIKVGDTSNSVLKVANQLGVSLPRLTQGFMGNKDAMNDVNTMLDNMIKSGTEYVDTETSKQEIMSESARTAFILKLALAQNNGMMDEAILKNKALDDATGRTAVSTNQLADEFNVLGDKASSAEQRVQALVEIMDVMAGRKPAIEEVTKTWEEFLDSFNAKDGGFESGIVGTKKWASALIDAQGHINLTTEDGRKLFETVRGAEKDFASMSQAMKDSGASHDEITAKLRGMRDQFIAVAQKMGFTKGQAELLANAYGLVPDNVSTVVNSNLSPEIQKALALGGTIRELPDGWFIVTANTDKAQGMITKLIQDNQGRVITLHINTVTGVQTSNNNGTFSRLKASGGPVASVSAATGGARSGVVTVNERGLQESANLPNGDKVILPVGSQVNPNAGNRQLAQGQGPLELRLYLDVSGVEGPFGRMVADVFRKTLRVSGKNGNINAWIGGRASA